jgi:hypothetical protein
MDLDQLTLWMQFLCIGPLGRLAQRMNAAYLSALSALAGSVVGGLMSGVGGWVNQRTQARAGQRANDILRRQDLYKDFIVAASRAYGKAIVSDEPQIEDLVALYAMISRMRVISSTGTVECADKIMHKTIATYFAPNKTIRELNDLIMTGAGIDPLKEFGEVAREELQALLSL